jgi:TDG/mug DNA glycosylase family protein
VRRLERSVFSRDLVLPDVLTPDLRVVFCGTAAGTASARRGAYYAGPGNKFWATLHEIGLTPRRLSPLEFASVLDYGIGLTDLCKLRAGSDVAIGRDAFDVAGLTARIAKHAPAFLAFNGIKAARETLGAIDGYGPQTLRAADAHTWVLPSTSGAASGFWDIEVWRALADAIDSRLSPPAAESLRASFRSGSGRLERRG